MTTDPQAQLPEEPSSADEQAPSPDQVVFYYEKSPLSRVIHADGAWGGPTAQGNIYMALFSEHQGLPDTVMYAIDEEQNRLQEIEQASQELPRRWLRQVEAEIIVSLSTARAVRDWLHDKITALERRQAEAREQRGEHS